MDADVCVGRDSQGLAVGDNDGGAPGLDAEVFREGEVRRHCKFAEVAHVIVALVVFDGCLQIAPDIADLIIADADIVLEGSKPGHIKAADVA